MKKTLLACALLPGCSTEAFADTDPLSAWNDTAAKQSIEQWVQNATQ